VSVRIATNSLSSTDNLFPQAAYVGKKRSLVRRGVELWEYQGPACLHAKAAVIDGETVIVGSFNLDPRSEFLNSEVALMAKDRTLAAVLTSIMDGHLRTSVRIDRRGWPTGAKERVPGISHARLMQLSLLRLLAPFIERQL
jgi:putative cardiolipin synthase